MNKKIAETAYFVMLGTLTIGAVLFAESQYFNQIWFGLDHSVKIIGAVYFATSATTKVRKWGLSVLSAWWCSALCFEVMGILRPNILEGINKPTHTVVWWILVFIVTIVIAQLNERITDSGITKVD